LIQHEPVHAKLSHGVSELGEVDGLHHIAVGARGVPTEQIFVLARGSKNDDGQKSSPFVRSNPSEHLEPAYFGQIQIEQDNLWNFIGSSSGVRALVKQVVERLGSIAGDHYSVRNVVLSECAERELLVD